MVEARSKLDGRILKVEHVRNRDVYSLRQILTAYKDLAWNREMSKAADKRLDDLESWNRWLLSFGIILGVRFLANICCSIR